MLALLIILGQVLLIDLVLAGDNAVVIGLAVNGLAPVALFWVFTGFYVFFSTFWFLTGALFLAGIAVLVEVSGRFSEP